MKERIYRGYYRFGENDWEQYKTAESPLGAEQKLKDILGMNEGEYKVCDENGEIVISGTARGGWYTRTIDKCNYRVRINGRSYYFETKEETIEETQKEIEYRLKRGLLSYFSVKDLVTRETLLEAHY